MIRNYFKIAFRLLLRNKSFSLINILGLAIGLCSSIIIFLYVEHQFSFDKFHRNSNNLYRFIMQEEYNGKTLTHPYCRLPMGPALKNDFPEVLETSRVKERQLTFRLEDKVHADVDILYVDSSFLKMFDFPLISGYKKTALNELNSILLTKELSVRMFGDSDPIGQTITTVAGQTLLITGVLKDPPDNTRFQFEAITLVDVFVNSYNYNFSWDGGPEFNIYAQLHPSANPEQLQTKFAGFFKKHNTKRLQDGFLQPVKEMHLSSSNFDFTEGEQRYSEVILFALIAVFILLIAIINYVNLSTARSLERAKEIGIKKVVGANRLMLIRQFYAESYLIVLISIFIALVFIEIFLPHVNFLLNENLSLYKGNILKIISILICFFIVVGGLSATYPALYLSSFNPSKVLKGAISSKSKSRLRTTLVVFQFLIATILISITIYSVQQMNFIIKKDKGYDDKNIIAVTMPSQQLRNKYKVIKNEIINLKGVESVSASSAYPGYDFTANGYLPEDYTDPMLIKLLKVDGEYIETMQMDIVNGRTFSDNLQVEELNFIINETLVKQLGWENPIGKTIRRNESRYRVIGVVKDFHFNTLQKKIEPLIITAQTSHLFGYYYLNIRMDGIQNEKVLREIEQVMLASDNSQIFNYVYLDSLKDDIYSSEYSFSQLFQLFSLLAICIACLGLYGLAAYTANQKIKEIGIRKALGASVRNLLLVLSKQYFIILMIANVIAIPIVIYAIRLWQSNYAYFIELNVLVFVLSFLISMLIAACIVFMISKKVITQNPVEALKYE